MVGGHPVGQGVRSAGVFRDVAADGAGALAGRIGRIKITVRLDRQRDVQVDDAGLYHGALILEIDLENPVHARKGHGNATGTGDRTSAQSRARAAANDRHSEFAADFDDLDYLFGGPGENDDIGPGLFNAAVVLVEGKILWLIEVAARTKQLNQLLFCFGRQHGQSSVLTKFIILSSVQLVSLMIFMTTLPSLLMM